jgi:hypothetical protein
MKINITPIVYVLLIYGLFTCVRNKSVNEIKECLKSTPAEICIKMHKGL